PNLYFDLRSENEAQGVGEAVDLASIAFPARPSRTPPQDTSAPPPTTLPPGTVEFVPGKIVIPSSPTPVTYSEVIVLDTSITLGPPLILPGVPTKDTTKDRFADVTRYIIPRAYGANNYVVTKVTNGVLTMKADPDIKADTLEREAAAAKRKADRDAFYGTTPVAPGEIRLAGTYAFGLPRDMLPTLRAAIGSYLNDEITKGLADEPGSLAAAINGGLQVTSWDQLPEDKIMAFLADIHTNPAKQAQVMPALMGYTMGVAQLDPAKWSDQDKQLMAFISPALKDARNTFIDEAKQARDDWVATEGAARGATFKGLLDGKVPYEKIVANAVGETMAEAMQTFQQKAEEFDATKLSAIGAGAAAGAIAGSIAGIQNLVTQTFPYAKGAVELALKRAGEKVTSEAMSKGLGRLMGSTGGGVGTIVSLAVTILITESMAIADNEKAAANFNALLNSGNDPIDPNGMMKSDQGKAVMLLGLSKLFLGGGGQKEISTNFDLN
ncbi:MAG TPA: hypothetical protein VEA63_05265, partial [Opitutus sp.]|nr:hypothetical protein [Opitutus sp.]